MLLRSAELYRRWAASRSAPDEQSELTHVHGIASFRRNVVDRCCAFQFIPGEPAAFERALQRFEKDDREQLAVSKTLQPDLAEQPHILFVVGAAAFQSERDGRCQKVDD